MLAQMLTSDLYWSLWDEMVTVGFFTLRFTQFNVLNSLSLRDSWNVHIVCVHNVFAQIAKGVLRAILCKYISQHQDWEQLTKVQVKKGDWRGFINRSELKKKKITHGYKSHKRCSQESEMCGSPSGTWVHI